MKTQILILNLLFLSLGLSAQQYFSPTDAYASEQAHKSFMAAQKTEAVKRAGIWKVPALPVQLIASVQSAAGSRQGYNYGGVLPASAITKYDKFSRVGSDGLIFCEKQSRGIEAIALALNAMKNASGNALRSSEDYLHHVFGPGGELSSMAAEAEKAYLGYTRRSIRLLPAVQPSVTISQPVVENKTEETFTEKSVSETSVTTPRVQEESEEMKRMKARVAEEAEQKRQTEAARKTAQKRETEQREAELRKQAQLEAKQLEEERLQAEKMAMERQEALRIEEEKNKLPDPILNEPKNTPTPDVIDFNSLTNKKKAVKKSERKPTGENLKTGIQVFPRFGLNFTSLSMDEDFYGEDYIDYKVLKPGFHIGLGILYGITEKWSINTELLYTQKGYKLKDNEYIDIFNMNCLEVPVLGQLNIKTESMNLFLNGGPYLSYWMSAKDISKDKDEGIIYKEKYEFDKPYDNRVDIGLSAGGGVEFNSPLGTIQLGMRFNLGLLDKIKWNDFPDGRPDEIKPSLNRALYLTSAIILNGK